MAAILSSTVVGFLCVIAAAVSPDTVFSVPAELLRRRHLVRLPADRDLADRSCAGGPRRTSSSSRCGPFPVLSFIVVAAILAVLAQMAFDEDARTQLLLSLLSWAIVVIIFFATKRLRDKAPAEIAAAPGDRGRPPSVSWSWPTRPSTATSCSTSCGRSTGPATRSTSSAFRPTRSTPDRRCTKGRCTSGRPPPRPPRPGWTERWRSCGRRTCAPTEQLGNYRPLRALADAVAEFKPDRLVICTHPEDRSAWLRYDVVDRAREAYDIPVTHVIVESVPAGV